MNQTSAPSRPTPRSKAKWIAVSLSVPALCAAGWWFQHAHAPVQAQTPDAASTEAPAISVRVTSPQVRTFEDRVVTQGNVQAKISARVSPKLPGVIEAFFVDEGDVVKAGETPLFATDAVKVQQGVVIQEHALAVSRCALDQAGANEAKVQADLDKATLDFKRFQRLLASGSTTQDAFEQQQSRFKQVTAAQALARSQVALAVEQVRQAEAMLTIARKDLADCTVVAPMTGVISKRTAEPGEMGSTGDTVLHIDNTQILEVSVFLPAAIYPRIVVGQTPMRISVSGIPVDAQRVTYKSPTIDSTLRTFEIKTLLQDPPPGMAPGAMAQVTVILAQQENPGVPAEALQLRSNQTVLFTVNGHVAAERIVTTGLESDGWIEITSGNVTPQDLVITMGQYQVENNTPVAIQKETR
ncbi:MAG: efflux RND transporter periplasmic adaptor subunit [Phycisphaerae bacterium]|nr:efflux RND transporter periplasmic adaptor subunit [Phycisphaerae bacterium]